VILRKTQALIRASLAIMLHQSSKIREIKKIRIRKTKRTRRTRKTKKTRKTRKTKRRSNVVHQAKRKRIIHTSPSYLTTRKLLMFLFKSLKELSKITYLGIGKNLL